MVIGNVCATVVQWRIQQLRGGISANERIDHQNSFNEKGNLHRTRNIDDAGVTVRILESDVIGACCGESMLRDIDILADVVIHVHLDLTVDYRRGTVTPKDLDFRTIGRTWGVSVGHDGKLVRQTGNEGITDLAGPLVCGKGCWRNHHQCKYNQKNM